MHEGDWLLLPFPAANRDPEAFPDADQVVIDRAENRHAAFGLGIHRCLGSNLARMELTVALEEWLAHYPDFELSRPRGRDVVGRPGPRAADDPGAYPLIRRTPDPSRRREALGWVYLLVSLNGAAYTLTAFRPPRRSRLLFGWSFLASWITIELAPYHLVWQIVATAVFGRLGAFRTRAGRIGLAVHPRRPGPGSRSSIRRSLAARGEIRGALRDPPSDAAPTTRRAVEVRRNIVFARAGAARRCGSTSTSPPAATAPGAPPARAAAGPRRRLGHRLQGPPGPAADARARRRRAGSASTPTTGSAR